MHFIAALRLLLGPENPLVSLSAHTSLLQDRFAPLDTFEATLEVKNGAQGTASISFGNSSPESEWLLEFADGTLIASKTAVTTRGEKQAIVEDGTGVQPEVRAWCEAILTTKENRKQVPEEALADLEVLEAVLKSGREDGKKVQLSCQML